MPNAKRKTRSTVSSSSALSSSSSSKKTKNSSSSSTASSTAASFDKNPFWVIYGRDDDDDDGGNGGGDGEDGAHDETFMIEEGDNHQQQQQQQQQGRNEADIVFDKMLQFTELTSRRKIKPNDGSTTTLDDADVKQGQGQVQTAVHHLLGYMLPIDSENGKKSITEQKNSKVATSCFVLSEDIARLLLPWAVKGILQDAYNKKKLSSLPSSTTTTAPVVSSESLQFLHWKTFDRCLSFFFDRSEERKEETGTGKGTPKSTKRSGNNNNFNTILTLSTLHKIVPIALSLALEEEEEVETVTNEISDPTTTVQNLANDCYCQLADNLYRPPFDVICDSLLPILTRDRSTKTSHPSLAANDTKMMMVGEEDDDGKKKRNNNMITTIWLRVAISTIRIMNSRIANANPKKSFQLLVRPKVFLDLAVVYYMLLQIEEGTSTTNKEQTEILKTLFNALIRDGIFSLEHHMDGFRSLQLAVPVFDTIGQKEKVEVDSAATTPATTPTTKSSFRGYQEGLLITLEGYLIVDDNSSKSSSIEAESISHITPLLLDIFLEQSSKVQQQTTKKSYKKTKVVDKLGHLQFRFFSCLTGNLLKGLLKSKNDFIQTEIDVRLRVSLFAMIGKNLDLLLKYNVYQPSLGNSAEQSFLDRIGKETIKSMTAQGENENENEKQHVIHYHISFAEWERSTRILDVILRLNHAILHEQLTVILSRCLTYCSGKGSDVATVAASAKAFLVTIIATYGKLRQLDYFYMNLLDAVSVLTREEESYRLVQLLAFGDDDDISRQIGTAIQESPIQQLKQIFSTVNESIVGRSEYSKDDSLPLEVTLLASSVITKLLTGLLRNVRVDSNSSNEIYPICKEIISGPITRLMEEDDDGNVNNAVMLCAWSIHLKNRCEFWVKQTGLSDQDKFNIPLSIHRVLKDAITTVVDYEVGDDNKEDRDLLESLKFFACQRIQQLHGEFYEKQRLAYASDAEQYNTSSEMSEARELVGFMLHGCYSNDRESDSKQKMRDQWVVLAGAISIWAPYAGENDINSFLNQLLQAVAIVGKSSGHRKEQIVSLLNDTSFYEIPNVSNRLGTNVVSFVAENIQKILGLCDGASPQLFEIALPILHPDWKSLSFTELLNVRKSRVSMICASNHLVEINELLLGSLQVLETINHVCIPIWEDCNDGTRTFESFQRIELICSMLLSKNGSSLLDTTTQLISELRIAASRVLGSISPQSNEKIFPKQNKDLMILLPQILKTTSICFDRSPSSGIMHRCIHSCNMLIGSIVEICMSHEENMITGLVQILDSTFHEDEAEVAQGGTHYLVLTSYAVTLLKKLRRSIDADADTDTDTAGIKECLRVIQKRLWIQAQRYCFDSPKDSNLLFRIQSRIFIAESLRLSSTCSEARTIPMSSIETNIVVKLRDLSTRYVDEFEMRSISYLVGCYAMTKPSGIVTQELTNELLVANLEGYDVFLTPLCVLARDMEPNEFDEFLNKLTSTLVKAPSKLKILHMLVLSVTNESQIEVIAKHSATIMSNCLQVMTQVAREVDVESESILEVSSLIVNMASRKDIMVLRERDIALILACITSTIRVDEDCVQKQTTEVHIKAYDASFLLVSSFLQRFSKQVHSCVPSLIISLNTMLQFALRESMPVTSMPSCGQKFSRLCELLLPYGEVYKKHIICLIVRFVDALQGTMNATCKKSLLPGIYCLLDIIQDHETMQLNSMLDEMGRALLRSLHEGYKKIHVYHGQ